MKIEGNKILIFLFLCIFGRVICVCGKPGKGYGVEIENDLNKVIFDSGDTVSYKCSRVSDLLIGQKERVCNGSK